MIYYLVTGGSGFIGRHLIKKLIEDGNKVINLDINKPNIVFKNEKFLKHNIKNEIKNIKNVNKIKAVVHLAAQTSSIISEENPKLDLLTNVIGTLSVIKFCKHNKIPILFTSSMAVYGNKKKNDATSLSVYGISKKFSESLLLHHNENINKVSILRLFNIYGPGQNLNNLKQGMISIFSVMAIKFRNIKINGTLNRTRDFLYISDAIEEIVKNLNKLVKSPNKKYKSLKNLRSGKVYSVNQLTKKIIKICKKNWNYNVRFTLSKGFKTDIDKIKSDKKFLNSKHIDLDEGLNKMLSWVNKKVYE